MIINIYRFLFALYSLLVSLQTIHAEDIFSATGQTLGADNRRIIQTFLKIDMTSCQAVSYDNSYPSVICVSSGFLGTKPQPLVTAFALNSYLPVTLPSNNLNIVVNTQCTVKEQCNYSYNQGQNKFFDEATSTTLISTGGGVQLYYYSPDPYLVGYYRSDDFAFTNKGVPVNIGFISASQLGFYQYIASMVLSLERNNDQNVFKLAYDQGLTLTPKFAFQPISLKQIKLLFNVLPDGWEDEHELPTFSPDKWDFQLASIYADDEEVSTESHFRTAEIVLYKQIQIPYSLANYFYSKYADLFEYIDYSYVLKNCKECLCLDDTDMPTIYLYTNYQRFSISPIQYMLPMNGGCGMEISKNHFILGAYFFGIYFPIFNPATGSIAFRNSEVLTTLEITEMYYLAALSGSSLGLLLILVTVMELNMSKLRLELKLFTKSKKH